MQVRPKSGAPRKTTPEEDNVLQNLSNNSPFDSSTKLLTATNLAVCKQTVIARLREAGIYCRRPAHVVYFTEEHAQRRMDFAIQNLYFDWTDVVFSDEKTFRSNQNSKTLVYRPVNTRYNREFVVPDKTSGRVTATYWAWMSSHGPGDFIPINGRLTAPLYINLLEEHILPLAYANGGHIVLVQDNSPIHTARIVQQWFAEHQEVLALEWPSKSPDLNPIENVWGYMVRIWDDAVGNRNLQNGNALRQQCQEVWEQIPPRLCNELVASMPRRLENVIGSGGYYTKY